MKTTVAAFAFVAVMICGGVADASSQPDDPHHPKLKVAPRTVPTDHEGWLKETRGQRVILNFTPGPQG
jgi:hypothetical protein